MFWRVHSKLPPSCLHRCFQIPVFVLVVIFMGLHVNLMPTAIFSRGVSVNDDMESAMLVTRALFDMGELKADCGCVW